MSTVRTKTLVLGDSGTLANNLQWKVPGVPDGTLTLEREDGTDVLVVDATGEVTITGNAQVGSSEYRTDSIELGLWGSGDRFSFIDFHSHGLPNANDFSARVIRNSGANGSFVFDNTGAGVIAFVINSAEQMRINPAGAYIGSPSPSIPARLAIQSTINDTKFSVVGYGDGIGIGAIFRSGNNIAAAAFQFREAGDAVVGSITTTGAGASYNTASDYRLKEGIAPIYNSLGRLMQLKPCGFTWKPDGSYDESFIAHELQEVCPRAVTGKKDAVKEDGTPDYQQIDPSKIVALLAAAMQEQQHIIQGQHSIIQDLQQRVANLEASK